MDHVVGRDDDVASGLTMMMLLIGSDRAMKRVMPHAGAVAQLRTALKSGPPIWWKMFAQRYRLTTVPDSAIASRIAMAPGAGPQLPESLGEGQSEDPAMRLDALRVAPEKADISVPAAANDAKGDKDMTDPALTDQDLQDHDAILEDDLPIDEPPDDGVIKLEEKHLVD